MKTQQNNGRFINPQNQLPLLFCNNKSFSFTFLMAGALALSCLMSACDKKDYNPAVLNQNTRVHTSGASAAAAIVTDYDDVWVGTYTDVNPCNGEQMTINYNIPIHVHSVVNGNRVSISYKAHFHYDGTGSAGNTYQGTGQQLINDNGIIENGAYTGDQIILVNMIAKGSAPNYQIRFTTKITISADGKITVFKIADTFECRS